MSARLPPKLRPATTATATPTGAATSALSDSIVSRLRARVCALPNPTLLFLLHVALILALRVCNAAVLKTWGARLLLPCGLACCLVASVVWRRPSARYVSERAAAAEKRPPGVVPDARALVRRGEMLRARDIATQTAERTLRRGQLRLEMLRKDIESRLADTNAPDRATAPLSPTSPVFLTAAGQRASSTERLDADSFRLS